MLVFTVILLSLLISPQVPSGKYYPPLELALETHVSNRHLELKRRPRKEIEVEIRIAEAILGFEMVHFRMARVAAGSCLPEEGSA